MALTESAGAAWATSATNAVSAASFTPAAGALVVAIAGVGNGNGITATTPFLVITSTFGGTASNTWTLLSTIHTAGDGLAGIWCMDAGAAPTAGVVTATATPSTVLDPGIIVRQFTGALPAASQTGATGTSSGTIDTVSVTPQQTGSQIVGAFGAPTTGAVTANAATTIYAQTQGNAGDTFGAFEGSALSTAGVAQVLGWTATKTATCIAAAEILPAAAGASSPPALPAQAGSTWRRRFRHPQQPAPVAAAPATVTAAPLTPLKGPVRARLPLPSRGHGGRSPGVFSGTGPPLQGTQQHPARAPVVMRQRKPRRGHGGKAAGVLAGVGPKLRALVQPVIARTRRGQASGTITLAPVPAAPAAGPPLTPLRGPVRARQPRGFPARGRAPLSTPPPAAGMQCGPMPGYLYPTYPNWAAFLASPGQLPSVVILNNGNGDIPWNSDYASLCSSLHALGITVLGYTYTNFGTRPAAAVQAAAGNYLGAGITPGGNGVDGIFLDQFQATAGGFSYYSGICSSIQAQFAAGGGSSSPPIWGNPGSYLDSSYLALPIQAFITFENHLLAYLPPAVTNNVAVAGVPQSGAGLYPRSRFAHLVYGATRGDVDGFADLAWANYAGWAFAGQGTGDNPYAAIPASDYLNDLVTRVRAEPSGQLLGMPPVTWPLAAPVRARMPQARGGRVISRAGTVTAQAAPTAGPPLAPRGGPLSARRRTPPPRGQVSGVTRAAAPAQVIPGTGPALTALHSPVRAGVVPSRGGRAATGRGLFSGQGPTLTALHSPVRGHPQARGGRAAAVRGPFSGLGPAVTPPGGPIAARRRTLPPRGRVCGIAAAPPPVAVIPGTGPRLYPLGSPVRARVPQARGGRSVSCRGLRSGTGPALTPLQGPCGRNRQGHPVPARGHGGRNPGVYAGQGRPVPPLRRGVSARLPRPVLTGRSRGTVAVGKFVPPPPFTVGALTAADAPGAVLTAAGASSALTASAAPQGTITATDQRTGGPS